MMLTIMQNRIAIVCLDLNESHLKFNDYNGLSAVAKIKKIAEHIRLCCIQLLETHQSAMWIVALREHAITDANSKFISVKDKKFLKSVMLEITSEFPNLTIIAGTVITKKHFSGDVLQNKLANIQLSYDEQKGIDEEEKTGGIERDYQISLHRNKVLEVDIQDKGVDVLRHTTYVFSAGEIKRHDKTIPFNEFIEKDMLTHSSAIFSPGKITTRDPYISLTHPITKVPINIGIEICREHSFGVLQAASKNRAKPTIHFLLSDSIHFKVDKVHGEYLVQLDSMYESKLIQTETPSGASRCELLQMDMLDRNPHLINRSKIHRPFESKFKNILHKANIHENGNPEMYDELNVIMNCKITLIEMMRLLYDWLKKYLPRKKPESSLFFSAKDDEYIHLRKELTHIILVELFLQHKVDDRLLPKDTNKTAPKK